MCNLRTFCGLHREMDAPLFFYVSSVVKMLTWKRKSVLDIAWGNVNKGVKILIINSNQFNIYYSSGKFHSMFQKILVYRNHQRLKHLLHYPPWMHQWFKVISLMIGWIEELFTNFKIKPIAILISSYYLNMGQRRKF